MLSNILVFFISDADWITFYRKITYYRNVYIYFQIRECFAQISTQL